MAILKKFLSKIRAFDLIVFALLVVILAIVLIFFYRKSEFVDIKVRVTDQNVLYAINNPPTWYANHFQAGDVERDVLGNIMTEIQSVNIHNVDNFTKEVILNLKVRATYDPRNQSYSSRGKKLAVGTSVKFSLSGISFDGIVISTPNAKPLEIKTMQKNVEVLVRGIRESETGKHIIEPRVLEAIKQGDAIFDSNGNVFAEVTKIKVYPAERSAEDARGIVRLAYDPVYKDALITLNMNTYSIGKEYYIFLDFPLRMGVDVNLVFTTSLVTGQIVAIND